MRKACFLGLLVALLAPAVWAQPIQVVLNGATVNFDQPPAMIEGRLMVPLRGIFEALQAEVLYDAPTRSIKATKGPTVVELALGSRQASINGRPVYLDVPAGTLGGRTMVPLRFVSEALGAEVKWQGATQTVFIEDGGSVAGPVPQPQPQSGSGARPTIDQVIHTATRTLQAGDTLDVIMTGDPGGQARFEIVGAIRPVEMREVGNGRYEGRYVIPRGLEVNQGVIVGYLTRGGLETVREASRTVTIAGGGSAQPTSQFQVYPTADSTLSETRFTLSLAAPQPIRPQTVRFSVDGIDFSRQVSVQGNRLTWTPGYELAPGLHQARFDGVGTNGQNLSHSWNFTIGQATGSAATLLPSDAETVTTSRPRIGARFGSRIDRSRTRLYIDNRDFTGSARFWQDGIYWDPNYDLSAGTHEVRVQTVDESGRVIDRSWSFVIGQSQAQGIQSVTFSPVAPRPGQVLTVTMHGPAGGSASVDIGGRTGLAMTERPAGTYTANYRVAAQDQGQQAVVARLRLPNGTVLTQQSGTLVDFGGGAALRVTNLSNGMGLPPVFNVQGQAPPGARVTVRIDYAKGDILGALTGATQSFTAVGTASAQGHFDIPVDASRVRQGRTMRITVSDSSGGQTTVEAVRN